MALKDKDNENILWQKYNSNKNAVNKEKLIKYYLPCVNAIVYGGKYTLDADDAKQICLMTLNKCIEDYDESKKCNFRTYAINYMKFRLQDEIRRVALYNNQTTRHYYKIYLKYISLINSGLSHKEVIERLNLKPFQTENLLKMNIKTFEYDDRFKSNEKNIDDSIIDNCEQLDNKIMYDKIITLKNNLDFIERKIIFLYFTKDLTLLQISKILNKSESRICQLLKAALIKLKNLYYEEN